MPLVGEKFRYTRSTPSALPAGRSGVAKAEVLCNECPWGAYRWYVEHFATQTPLRCYDAVDRMLCPLGTFYDAINI